MSNVKTPFAQQPGDAAEQGDAHDDQQDAGCLGEERFVSLEIGADQTGGSPEGDERRGEAGDEQEAFAQDLRLLTKGPGNVAGHLATHVADVGRDEREKTRRGAGQDPGQERDRQKGGH